MPSKKIHPADQLDRDAVATAVSFNVFFRRSPTSKISREAASLAEAIKISDEIVAEVTATGRKGKVTPLIYAIQKAGSQSPVPADMIEAARAESAMQAEAEAKTQPKKRKTIKIDSAIFHASPKAKANEKSWDAIPSVARAGKRAQAEADAAAGIIPAAPDFSAETHKPYRAKLAQLVELVEAGDIAKLKAFPINPYSSSPKALDRYRNLAVIALKAQKKAA